MNLGNSEVFSGIINRIYALKGCEGSGSGCACCRVNVFDTPVSWCIHLVSPVKAAPSDWHTAHKYQPGLPADRVFWAVRPWFQLHEDWHQSEEWRGLPVQRGHVEGHGKWKQTINALHRRSNTAWWDGDYGINFPVRSDPGLQILELIHSWQETMWDAARTAFSRSSRCLILPTWCSVMVCLLLHVLIPTKSTTGCPL